MKQMRLKSLKIQRIPAEDEYTEPEEPEEPAATDETGGEEYPEEETYMEEES